MELERRMNHLEQVNNQLVNLVTQLLQQIQVLNQALSSTLVT